MARADNVLPEIIAKRNVKPDMPIAAIGFQKDPSKFATRAQVFLDKVGLISNFKTGEVK